MGRNKKTKEEKAFEKWKADGRPQIFYKKIADKLVTAELTTEKDEVFVPVWKDGKYDKKHYISNYGQVISFIGKPKIIAVIKNQKANKKVKTDKQYNVCSLGRVNRLVAFSFSANAIKEHKFAIWIDEDKNLELIADYKRLKKVEKKAEVHHINENELDDRTDNLAIVSQEMHNFYTHALKEYMSDELQTAIVAGSGIATGGQPFAFYYDKNKKGRLILLSNLAQQTAKNKAFGHLLKNCRYIIKPDKNTKLSECVEALEKNETAYLSFLDIGRETEIMIPDTNKIFRVTRYF